MTKRFLTLTFTLLCCAARISAETPTLVFGDLVVAREKVTRPDGVILDQLSIYRVRNGRILDDWFVAAAPYNQ